MKRGVIQFSGATEKVRISKPGVDVDTAGTLDFLLHENALYSQPYFSAFVTCPFAGNTSTGVQDQTVDVTVPNVTTTPVVMFWVVDSDSLISFPAQKGFGTGNSASGFSVNSFVVSYQIISSTVIRVRFFKSSNSLRSPQGAYLILSRKPDP